MGRRLALLIATYEYEDTGLRRLTTPAHDAEALAAVLEDPGIAGFDVRTLVNAPTHEVGEAIAAFYSESRRDDLTLLYFTGHGLKDDNGRLYLAMSNTKRDNLRFTALSAGLVDEAMNDSISRQKVLILDCCYSGSYETQQFAKSDSAVHTLEKLGGRGRTVLTASDSTQYAFEGTKIHGEAAQSVFTSHLVAGLRDGTADLDRDGDITVDELYNYVYDRVTAEQPNQRPKKLDQVEGRTVVASNVNWSLPSHIAEAVASLIPAARQAAIEPLGRLLWANNELVRRTARGQLELLLEDDSRAVSTAAQAILDSPAPEPQPMPIATIPARQSVRPGSAEAISISAAVRASVRRWRGRLKPAATPWPVYGLSLLAAASLLAAFFADFQVWHQADVAAWYVVAATVVTCGAVVVLATIRSSAEVGAAFAVGFAAPGLLGSLLVVGWLTSQLHSSVDLYGELLPGSFAVLGHVAWVGAGVAGLIYLRRADALSLRLSRLVGRDVWLFVGLGTAAAVAQLVIQVYGQYHSSSDFGWRLFYPVALGILATEFAIAGPVVAGLLKPGLVRLSFLGGWVLGGCASWIGIYRDRGGFVEPKVGLIALLVLWLLLGVIVIAGLRLSAGEEPGQEAGQKSRLVAVIAAALVLPVVLGGAVIIVVPQGPATPIALGLAVSQDNRYLYVADVANDRVMRISTTTREQVGDAVKVGESPTSLLLDPVGERLYVANSEGNSVSVVDFEKWKTVGQIPVAPKPVQLALDPADRQLFVLSPEAATITVVDTDKLSTVGGPISAGAEPADLAVNPAKHRLYVASGSTASITVIDTRTRQPARSPIKVDEPATDLSLSADGYLFVVSVGSFSIVNTTVDDPRPSSFPLPGKSSDGVLSADGKHLFVLGSQGEGANRKDTVISVGTKSHQVEGTVSEDSGLAARLAVSQDGQRLYVSRFFDKGVLVLDATGPKVIGSIALER